MDIEETGIRNKLKSNIQHIYSFKDFGNYEGIYTMYMLGLCGIMKLFNQLTCHTCTRFRTDDFGGQNSKGLNWGVTGAIATPFGSYIGLPYGSNPAAKNGRRGQQMLAPSGSIDAR